MMGVDIGGTKYLARIESEAGTPLATLRRPSGRDTTPRAVLTTLSSLLDECGANQHEVVGIGIGFPGLTNGPAGRVLSSVILNGWRDVRLAELVSVHTGLPCAIDNDVKTAARAEIRLRPPRSYSTMLFVSIGTGIGGAIVRDGQIVPGADGLAGEVGHIAVDSDGPLCRCGRRGCVGAQAGGAAIAARLGLTADGVSDAVTRGDPAAVQAVGEAARLIGRALGSVLNLLNPDLVVVGGGVGQGETFLSVLAATARQEAFAEIAAGCRFERALAGYEAGAIGAVQLAREAVARAPLGPARRDRRPLRS
jgi:glucokinase